MLLARAKQAVIVALAIQDTTYIQILEAVVSAHVPLASGVIHLRTNAWIAILVQQVLIIAVRHALERLQPNVLHAILVLFFIQKLGVISEILVRKGIGEAH